MILLLQRYADAIVFEPPTHLQRLSTFRYKRIEADGPEFSQAAVNDFQPTSSQISVSVTCDREFVGLSDIICIDNNKEGRSSGRPAAFSSADDMDYPGGNRMIQSIDIHSDNGIPEQSCSVHHTMCMICMERSLDAVLMDCGHR